MYWFYIEVLWCTVHFWTLKKNTDIFLGLREAKEKRVCHRKKSGTFTSKLVRNSTQTLSDVWELIWPCLCSCLRNKNSIKNYMYIHYIRQWNYLKVWRVKWVGLWCNTCEPIFTWIMSYKLYCLLIRITDLAKLEQFLHTHKHIHTS